jgi:16S rRNA pseudouridine516 synthase
MGRRSLDRILQSQGFGTRGHCRELVCAGEVHVGGQPVTDAAASFETEGLRFTIFGEEWLYLEHVYLALNKPPGYECSRKPSHHPGILKLLPEQFTWRDVQPVGRLDHDTTGLLLLSDDGAFIHAQSSPRRHVPKTYVATTQDPVSDELIALLQEGVQLNDEPKPLSGKARRLDEHALEIVLDQGKYHQVKRMLAAAGNHCAALRRVAIGGLTLDSLSLEEGKWRHLDAAQLELLTAI